MTLTEIAPGLWVRADQVLAIRTTREHTYRTVTSKPAVTMHMPHCHGEIGWEFETWDDALAWARNVTAKVNAALQASSEYEEVLASSEPLE